MSMNQGSSGVLFAVFKYISLYKDKAVLTEDQLTQAVEKTVQIICKNGMLTNKIFHSFLTSDFAGISTLMAFHILSKDEN